MICGGSLIQHVKILLPFRKQRAVRPLRLQLHLPLRLLRSCRVISRSREVKNLNREDVSTLLNTGVEVVAWRQERNCSRVWAIVVTGAEPVDSTEVILQTSEKTLRDNLDEIVSQLGTYFGLSIKRLLRTAASRVSAYHLPTFLDVRVSQPTCAAGFMLAG